MVHDHEVELAVREWGDGAVRLAPEVGEQHLLRERGGVVALQVGSTKPSVSSTGVNPGQVVGG
jgi:hypothetical protein